MTLIKKIRTDWITARKEKSDTAKPLGFLYAELKKLNKDKQKDAGDDDSVRVIKKLLSKNREMHKHIVGNSSTDEINLEYTVLETYLPAMADDQLVREFILKAIVNEQAIGQIMGGLKKEFGETVDMKYAAGLVASYKND